MKDQTPNMELEYPILETWEITKGLLEADLEADKVYDSVTLIQSISSLTHVPEDSIAHLLGSNSLMTNNITYSAEDNTIQFSHKHGARSLLNIANIQSALPAFEQEGVRKYGGFWTAKKADPNSRFETTGGNPIPVLE